MAYEWRSIARSWSFPNEVLHNRRIVLDALAAGQAHDFSHDLHRRGMRGGITLDGAFETRHDRAHAVIDKEGDAMSFGRLAAAQDIDEDRVRGLENVAGEDNRIFERNRETLQVRGAPRSGWALI
jgi:hypothetical protein